MWRSKTRSAMVVACLLLSGFQVGSSQAGTAEASSLLQATPDAHPDGANDIDVLWRVATAGQIVSPPLVAQGAVYVRSAGTLYALDAATGMEWWRFETEDLYSESLAVVGGAVYIGSAGGNFYALDARRGTEQWRFEAPTTSPPMVVDGVVYIGSPDGNLYALDAGTGTERWRFSTKEDIVSTLVVADGVVYVGTTDGKVYGLDAALGTGRSRFTSLIYSSPVVADGVVYFGSSDGTVYAVDAATGNEQWRLKIEGYASTSMTVVDDIVYFGSGDGNVYALGARPLILEAGGQAVVTRDGTVLRGAPAVSGVERATLSKATAVTLTGEAVHTGNLTWWPVTVDDTGELGWIVADELEPTANRTSATPSAHQLTATLTAQPASEATETLDDLVIEPIDGTVIEIDDTEVVQPIGEIETAKENDGTSGPDLGTAPELGSLASVPGDPAGRLHIDQDGQPIFSSTPGGVSFTRDGLTLEQRDVDTGASVFVCDDTGSCVVATSASADGARTDYPLGWLGSTFIYERVKADGAVSFRGVALADGSLDVVEDRELGRGGPRLETLTRAYAVEGGLLVPALDAWLEISTEGVRQIDGNPYGSDISRLRTAPAAGTIAYLAEGQIVIASLSAPGTPEAVIPFDGTDYVLAPDGSRVAVTDGATIRVLDRTGREVASFANEAGIAIGGIAWGEDGIVFVDQSSGVLRVIQP